jgi:hypothetical protein
MCATKKFVHILMPLIYTPRYASSRFGDPVLDLVATLCEKCYVDPVV